jgi:hypothetical protein
MKKRIIFLVASFVFGCFVCTGCTEKQNQPDVVEEEISETQDKQEENQPDVVEEGIPETEDEF